MSSRKRTKLMPLPPSSESSETVFGRRTEVGKKVMVPYLPPSEMSFEAPPSPVGSRRAGTLPWLWPDGRAKRRKDRRVPLLASRDGLGRKGKYYQERGSPSQKNRGWTSLCAPCGANQRSAFGRRSPRGAIHKRDCDDPTAESS